MGYEEWFISLTPVNLAVSLFVILWVEEWKAERLLPLVIPFSIGMIAEILGVNYGFFFGDYTYGENLGPKVLGVPWFIGINWAILTYCSANISRRITKNLTLSSIIAAAIMVTFDVLIELVAPRFDFWEFKNGIIPLRNYISWFAFGFLANFLFQKFNPKGNGVLATNILLAFTLFFLVFVFF
ncbi:hypothetical protein GCM10007940_24700 [Portibacter lacus]|uniref:Carotenoid biosynthesis protein n=2 Tax=Portibacter lacus TaxID=1099794 RepID=A0AA37STQ7_9BACT|nr:hypothetical protein GCM10007940_24700 [Portibacter lacus]